MRAAANVMSVQLHLSVHLSASQYIQCSQTIVLYCSKYFLCRCVCGTSGQVIATKELDINGLKTGNFLCYADKYVTTYGKSKLDIIKSLNEFKYRSCISNESQQDLGTIRYSFWWPDSRP